MARRSKNTRPLILQGLPRGFRSVAVARRVGLLLAAAP